MLLGNDPLFPVCFLLLFLLCGQALTTTAPPSPRPLPLSSSSSPPSSSSSSSEPSPPPPSSEPPPSSSEPSSSEPSSSESSSEPPPSSPEADALKASYEICQKIRLFVNTLLKCRNCVGSAVSVVKNDEVVFAEGFGLRNLYSKKRVDKNTIFGIASLSKAITAATLIKVLSEKKRLTQDTPLRKILDISFSSEQRTRHASVEDLLAHRMGIPRNNLIRLNPNFTRNSIPRYVKHFKPYLQFRSGFLYNNIMYGLATHVTELLTHKIWENVVTDKIFRPLQMNESTFGTVPKKSGINIASSYVEDSKGNLIGVPASFKRKWSEIGGSGGIQSTAVDMANWIRFLLNKGKFNGKVVFNSTVFEKLFRTHNYANLRPDVFQRPNTPVTYSNERYALGWRKGYYRGYPLIDHTGTSWGDNSLLTLFPKENLGIFLTMTGSDDDHIKRYLLMNYIADLYLGEQPWLNQSTMCSFLKPSIKSARPKRYIHLRREIPPEYVGTYSNSVWGKLYVRYDKKSKRQLTFTYGYATFKLYSKRGTSLMFTARGVGEMYFMNLSSVQFIRSKRKRNAIIAVSIPSFERLMPPVFKKIRK